MELVVKFKSIFFRWFLSLLYTIAGFSVLFTVVDIIAINSESTVKRLAKEALEKQKAVEELNALYPENLLELVKGKVGDIGGELSIGQKAKNLLEFKLAYFTTDYIERSYIEYDIRLIIDTAIDLLIRHGSNPEKKHKNITIRVKAEKPEAPSPTGAQETYRYSINNYYDPLYPVDLLDQIKKSLTKNDGQISLLRMRDNSLYFLFNYHTSNEQNHLRVSKDMKSVMKKIINVLVANDLNPDKKGMYLYLYTESPHPNSGTTRVYGDTSYSSDKIKAMASSGIRSGARLF